MRPAELARCAQLAARAAFPLARCLPQRPERRHFRPPTAALSPRLPEGGGRDSADHQPAAERAKGASARAPTRRRSFLTSGFHPNFAQVDLETGESLPELEARADAQPAPDIPRQQAASFVAFASSWLALLSLLLCRRRRRCAGSAPAELAAHLAFGAASASCICARPRTTTGTRSTSSPACSSACQPLASGLPEACQHLANGARPPALTFKWFRAATSGPETVCGPLCVWPPFGLRTRAGAAHSLRAHTVSGAHSLRPTGHTVSGTQRTVSGCARGLHSLPLCVGKNSAATPTRDCPQTRWGRGAGLARDCVRPPGRPGGVRLTRWARRRQSGGAARGLHRSGAVS